MSLAILKDIVNVDILKEGCKEDAFVGRPFYLDYQKAYLLVADSWKYKVGGIPQGSFLLAFYENENDKGAEAILLRVLEPTDLPTENDVTSSMIEYYKDNLKTTGSESELDQFTRYEFSFSGLECKVLGTFYQENGKTVFGADVENFYSAHHYKVYKPRENVLGYIVNAGSISAHDVKIGSVRYSSSRRFQDQGKEVAVCINPQDFLGKRTALFGMTRTGKSNTVKKIIEATEKISGEAKSKLTDARKPTSKPEANLTPFDSDEAPKFPVGQIIFDINGEYANANLQDEGTAIFELYQDKVSRYSTIPKDGFKIMKINFYTQIESGFEIVKAGLVDESGHYVQSFRSIELIEPEEQKGSAATRYRRKKAVYQCCLYKAGFDQPSSFKVYFETCAEIQEQIELDALKKLDPKSGISVEEATEWFEYIWDHYEDMDYFKKYKNEKGREWADEDLKALLTFLTRKKSPGGSPSVSGYTMLRSIQQMHTASLDSSFEEDIIQALRNGEIVIVDLSQGEANVQSLYSERICKKIFNESLATFISNKPNNFIQFYFEEAHNLFPHREDRDLSQIYNKIAKEGAKLNLALIYATQEVSSISANILKNTQNWFIAHLNNEDEIRELRKYYDFSDFTDGLIRFSADKDKGFVRMKTYSNPFVVPVQIDRFTAKK